MEDTSPEIRASQQKMWSELSVEERLRRLGDLYALAKTFAESRAPSEFSAEEKQRFVFRELYGFSLPDNK